MSKIDLSKLTPTIFALLIAWAIIGPIFFSHMFFKQGAAAGREQIANMCWDIRGFSVDKNNVRYFFDCNKTSEKPISPWKD